MTTRRGKTVEAALRRGGFVKARPLLKLSTAEMVRILRDKNELTQTELADKAGLTQATISSIENERVRLGVERAKALARALHVHPGVLLFPSWDAETEGAA
ncbi:MAG: helix-turn-helix transcriptional regulator [Deltaproteobacteria bacterium]|nr:helix-turn-helix transcriptional regulator [Deltaproteobacteria bacterium]MBW2162145.1 helix-turn-helix transcriptional regulator [Deltaproteobacteria bacterium]